MHRDCFDVQSSPLPDNCTANLYTLHLLPVNESLLTSTDTSLTMRLLLYNALVAAIPLALANFDASHVSWYTTPANNFTSTLPIGNGRLGAAIWGTATENVTLNENSIWSGPFISRVNPRSYDALWPVRSLLAEGNMTEGNDATLANMVGIPDSPQSYSALGSLVLDFGHDEAGISNYTRYLDLRSGVAVVEYTYRAVRYRYVSLACPSGYWLIKIGESIWRVIRIM